VPFENSRATEFWLRIEQSILIGMEKSAEGIVVYKVALMGDWKRAAKLRRTHPTKARTVPRERIK